MNKGLAGEGQITIQLKMNLQRLHLVFPTVTQIILNKSIAKPDIHIANNNKHCQ